MIFHSILFRTATDYVQDGKPNPPDFFVDLNLDQIIASITDGKEEYNLKPFFFRSLHDIDAIIFRQEIMRDLENMTLLSNLKAFAQSMHAMRDHIAKAETLPCKLQKQRWFLEAVSIYCDAVLRLLKDLRHAELASRGLAAFREYVAQYATSESFNLLLERTEKLATALSAIRYTVLIDGNRVQVDAYAGEPDYSAEVKSTFETFSQVAVKNFVFGFSESPEMNPIEVKIADLVSQLYAEIFSSLEKFCVTYQNYRDTRLVTFDREIQFYIAYLDHLARFETTGLKFCYSRVARNANEIYSYQSFDLALAGKLIPKHDTIVCNDFYLRGRERIIIVSGPNQGGKTTFARTFGQLHYLASLGCPVPGTQARLFLFDMLFTHFERREELDNPTGKLQADLVRLHDILERATPKSIIIMNEIFTSTTLQDAIILSKRLAERILALDALCLWVTFVDELASLNDQIVSMVSTVDAADPALRTYQVVRKPADGLAHALSIAEKYRLTYAMIKERVNS